MAQLAEPLDYLHETRNVNVTRRTEDDLPAHVKEK
jgi:hypothetical protein